MNLRISGGSDEHGVSALHATGLVALCVVVFFGLLAGQAWAGKGVVGFFGSQGQAEGQFTSPRDIAVNLPGGDSNGVDGFVYVVDEDNNRIQVFDADGEFEFTFGSGVNGGTGFEICTSDCVRGSADDEGAGGFDDPQGIDIRQSTGEVFVRDRDNLRVQVFEADGTFAYMFGAGVNATNPGNLCTAASNDTCKIGVPGSDPGAFGASSTASTGLAIDQSTGLVYVADPGGTANRRIQVFDVDDPSFDGTPDHILGGNGAGNGQFGANQPIHLAVANGALFASDTNTQLECFDTATQAVCASGPVTALSSSTSTTALEIDPASGNLLVGRSTQIEELDVSPLPATNTGDPHLAGSGITSTGIGVGGSTIYAASTSQGSHRIFMVDTTTAPEATIDAPEFTAQRATFTGTVDPNGSPTGYRFEYVDDVEYQANGWTNALRTPLGDDATVGGGNSAVEVEQKVANLKPNAEYHVRLVAKQTFGTETGIAGGPDGVTFTTPGLLPAIFGTGARGGSPAALLWATIEPNNSPTTYYFEYGTTTGYGSQTAPASLSGIDASELVSAPLTNLAPNTVYHYRVVATNGEGTTEGPDRTFSTFPGPVPAARGYELVNHVDMGGSYAAYPQTFNSQGAAARRLHPAAPDGERFLFRTSSPVPGTNATRSTADYIAERTAQGWVQHYVGAPGDRVAIGGLTHVAEDLSRVGLAVEGSAGVPGVLDPDDPGDALDYYWHDLNGGFTWATRRSPAVDSANPLELYQPSPDANHWTFLAPVPPGDPRPPIVALDGQSQEIVSVLPDGGIARSAAGLQQADAVGYAGPRISPDGDRVVFRARPTGANSGPYFTWVRLRSAERTVQVDAPAPGVDTPQQQSVLEQLSRDGSTVLFTTPQRLVPEDLDDQVDLYRFDIDAERVELVSQAADDAPSDGQGGACGASYPVSGCAVLPGTYSRDGRTAYFVSPERLAVGAKQGEPNLYIRRGDTTSLVAVLVPGDVQNVPDTTSAGSWYSAFEPYRPARVTEDGSRLVFESRAQLTAYDNQGEVEIYVYDADSGSVSCASCAQGSFGPNAEAQLRSPVGTHFPNFNSFFQIQGRNITAGAEQVYFQTTERLVAEDVNGTWDVYEFDVESGRIILVSSGTAPRGEFYFDNSVDGEHVFFASSQNLVPAEQDRNGELWKVFDAHRGGGFAAEPPALGCTEADCRGPAPEVPTPSSVGSDGLAGDGNVPAAGDQTRAAIGVHRLKAVRGSSIRIRVRVSDGGVIALAGRHIRRVRRTVPKAGTYGLRVALSPRARRTLRKRGRLRVGGRVTYRAKSGETATKRVRVSFRHPGASKRAKRLSSRAGKGGR